MNLSRFFQTVTRDEPDVIDPTASGLIIKQFLDAESSLKRDRLMTNSVFMDEYIVYP